MEKEKKQNTRKSLIKETAFEKHVYSVTLSNGDRLTDIEDIIEKIESKGAPVLKNF